MSNSDPPASKKPKIGEDAVAKPDESNGNEMVNSSPVGGQAVKMDEATASAAAAARVMPDNRQLHSWHSTNNQA
jgi:hypothetical protein